MPKERERKQLQCSNLKQDPTAYKKYLQKDRQRKKQKVANFTPLVQSPTLSDNSTITPNQSPSTSTLTTPFSNRASLHRSVNKAALALPKSSWKKTHVIHSLIHNLYHHQEEIWAKWWDGSLTNLPPQGSIFYLKKSFPI